MAGLLDLNLFRVFAAVVESGSFVGAARRLGAPPSNVSRYVAQLETRLGIRLIERSTRAMSLTPSGEALFSEIHPALEQLRSAEITATTGSTQIGGVLRIRIPNELGPIMLGSLLSEFALAYPSITLSCVTSPTGFESGFEAVDLAVVVHRGRLPDSGYVAVAMAELPCTVVGAPELVERVGRPQKMADLKTLPCITTVDVLDGKPWLFLDDKGNQKAVEVRATFRANSGELALKASLAGLGYAILARLPCQAYFESNALVPIDLDGAPLPLCLFAVFPSSKMLPHRARVFMEFLQEKLSTYQLDMKRFRRPDPFR